jgi:hypothetical protein
MALLFVRFFLRFFEIRYWTVLSPVYGAVPKADLMKRLGMSVIMIPMMIFS